MGILKIFDGVMMQGLFEDRKVLITGAGNGIGAAIAEHFAQLGATVALIDFNSDLLVAKHHEMVDKGYSVRSFCTDISNYEACQAAYEYFYNEIGFIDTLVKNAGISPKHQGHAHKIWQLCPEEWQRVIDVNLNGSFNFIRILVPEMIKHKFGKIINTSSVAANAYLPVVACHYSATKAAIIGLTRHLAGELGIHNIHVNSIAPGRIETPMVLEVGGFVAQRFKR
ncbi:SDR family oxidoreductase [Acinetobacter soli]|uniref:SDR family oxidoreductase n=1 Tax=Acinetobacter soli TaxID=487316 RepID=UPI00207703DA|nr:SDR family NAD(P)-dependent oxidoreductase [Acinetobacter soli]